MHGLPVDTEAGPPLGLPLRFFLAGLAYLVTALVVGVLDASGLMPGLGRVTHAHLLLAGWACLTIMGAMTQFVPTWSGEDLYWRRLIEVAFPLVAFGIAGLAAGFTLGTMWVLPVTGGLAALGFWLFVVAMLRTLIAVRPWDVTEAHFALALAFLAVVPGLGVLLTVDFTHGILGSAGIAHDNVVGAHATLAVFGVILTTILGALVQLATMFTQARLTRTDTRFLLVERATYPLGVVLLSVGRLVGDPLLARAGAVFVGVGLVVFGIVLAHLLARATVDYTPMHSRYGVVAASMVAWVVLGLPVILVEPVARGVLFGGPDARFVLFLGVIAFTILGTLYHVIPFLVWLDRYADRVGLEPVPAIDDMYRGRVAKFDWTLTTAGLTLAVVGARAGSTDLVVIGTGSFLLGAVLAGSNLVDVLVQHARPESPYGGGDPTTME